MISRRVAAIVLVTSVVGGVAVGFGADAMTSDRAVAGPPLSDLVSVPVPVPDVEVIDPVLVVNDDGTATLSATLLNHTQTSLEINDATNGQQAYDGSMMLLRRPTAEVALEPGASMRVGGLGDVYRARTRDQVPVGSTQPVTVRFSGHERYEPDAPSIAFTAPVVARSSDYAEVANNGPNPDITVHDPVIVVVPGQRKAYVGGWFESTVDDMTDIRPTIDPQLGQSLQLLHQTATGGPSGFFAEAGERSPLGFPPYLDTEPHGDADYVLASEVTVGQKIKVTFRFPSGDVVARFRVVQGRADGTI